MDEIKAQKKALKKAYKKAKRKNVLAWKILTILCAVVMVISVPLSVLAVKFDNTMAARFGGSFWKLQNEDTNAQYYTSDFNSAEEMVDYGLALTQQVEAEGAALLRGLPRNRTFTIRNLQLKSSPKSVILFCNKVKYGALSP